MSGKHQLTNIMIGEISLVDDGANPEAHVLIVKAKGKLPCADCKSPEVCKKKGACKEHGEPDGDEGGKMEVGKSADIVNKTREVIASMTPEIIGTVAKAFPGNPQAAAIAAAILMESEMDMEELAKSLETAQGEITKLTDLVKAKDAEISGLKAAVEKAKKPEPTEEDFMKSLPEAVRKRFEDLEKAKVEQAAVIEKMATEREEAAFIEKAKGYKIGDAAVLGPLLRRVEKGMTMADDATALDAILKAASAQVATSPLFKAIGTSSTEGADAEVLLKAKAEEIQKANAGMTYEKAFDKALAENPKLYNDYIAKRRTVSVA